jgi:hypothetical protein
MHEVIHLIREWHVMHRWTMESTARMAMEQDILPTPMLVRVPYMAQPEPTDQAAIDAAH